MNNSLLFWNEVALDANKLSHSNGLGEQTGPPLSARALALVHLAMYDAYIGTSGTTLDKYLALPNAVGVASVDAAIAASAHTVLLGLYPGLREFLNNKFQQEFRLASTPDVQNGYEYGHKIGKAILANRAKDPNASDKNYVGCIAYGNHRPAPDAEKDSYHAPHYGNQSKPFASNINFSLDAFPALNSAEYQASLKIVREKGIKPELSGTINDGDRRTDDETIMGIYWGYDGANGLGTPPRLYNQIIKQLAIKAGLNLAQCVNLFALVNVSLADAGIFAWRDKYKYNIWRPVLGIRENDISMGLSSSEGVNPVNNADCLWLPLGAPKTNGKGNNFTPDFPAYPSGHATFGAAAFEIARQYFKYIGINPFNTPFEFVSEEFNSINRDNNGVIRSRHIRRFNNFEEMIRENGFSRVFLGVHWSLDAFALDTNGNPDYSRNIGGAKLGKDIATHIFNRYKVGTDGITQSTLLPLETPMCW